MALTAKQADIMEYALLVGLAAGLLVSGIAGIYSVTNLMGANDHWIDVEEAKEDYLICSWSEGCNTDLAKAHVDEAERRHAETRAQHFGRAADAGVSSLAGSVLVMAVLSCAKVMEPRWGWKTL